MACITSFNSIGCDGLGQFGPVQRQAEGARLYFLAKHAQIIFLIFYKNIFAAQIVKDSISF